MEKKPVQCTRTLIRIACIFFLSAMGATVAGPTKGLSTAPSFTARDINNRLVSLDSLKSRGPVIVSFWATWCVPCLMEFRALKKLAKKYADKNLSIVAVSLDTPAETAKVKQMAAANRWPFTVVIDAGKTISSKYQVTAVPALFLIDSDGNILLSTRGYITGDEKKLEEAIRGLPDAP
jgi:cytochrome c biogenesis protein CcmG/thiol:disulfide interchange protein DsbE